MTETINHEDAQNRGADTTYKTEKTATEEFRLNGEGLRRRLRELLREGNVRRIVFKNDEGKTLLAVPLTAGVVGALLLPVWVGVGVVVALVANLTITVHRRPDPTDIKIADEGVRNGPEVS